MHTHSKHGNAHNNDAKLTAPKIDKEVFEAEKHSALFIHPCRHVRAPHAYLGEHIQSKKANIKHAGTWGGIQVYECFKTTLAEMFIFSTYLCMWPNDQLHMQSNNYVYLSWKMWRKAQTRHVCRISSAWNLTWGTSTMQGTSLDRPAGH